MATENEPTLADIADRLGSIDNRLGGIDNRLDGMDNRLDGIDNRLDGMDNRLDGIDKRLDGMDNKTARRTTQDRQHSANEHKQTRAAIRDATQGINVVIGQTEDRLADRIADAEASMSEALDAHARDPLAHN